MRRKRLSAKNGPRPRSVGQVTTRIAGLVLAGGAGTRYGMPKALAATDGVPWIHRVVAALRDGGCDEVVVALGARADEALPLVPPEARAVVAERWRDGVSATLRAGLDVCAPTPDPAGSARIAADPLKSADERPHRLPGRRFASPRAARPRGPSHPASDSPVDAVVICPVDAPGVPAAAVARLLSGPGDLRDALRQATYAGRPGHPVLVGARHLPTLAASATGDRGARPFLIARGVREIECGDLWDGLDIDTR